MNRKRPSGAYFRKQKKIKDENDKKMRETLGKFLKQNSNEDKIIHDESPIPEISNEKLGKLRSYV